MQSCGSICVTYALKVRPSDETNFSANAGQSASGHATMCALYEPVAPAILPAWQKGGESSSFKEEI